MSSDGRIGNGFGVEDFAVVRATINKLLRRSSRCDSDVDDLVQTSLLRFLSALRAGRVSAGGPAGGYLATIARNAAYDWTLARSRQNKLREAFGHIGDIADNSVGPERFDIRAVQRFVRQLAPELARVYELRFGNNLSQLQVARTLKTSRQRVRTMEDRLLDQAQRTLCAADVKVVE